MTPKHLSVLIVCDPITNFTAGGTVSTLRFAENLRARGHKIVFTAARYAGQPPVDFYHGFKLYRFSSIALPKNEKQFRMSFPTQQQIEGILVREGIDVAHFMLPHPAGLATIRAARAVSVGLVAHSHTQPENIAFDLPTAALRSLFSSLAYRYLAWVYRQADAVVYPTELAQRLIADYLRDNTPSVVISNGVDIRKFCPRQESAPLDKSTSQRASLRLLFVGRLHPEKAVDTLIKALSCIIARHPRVYVSIVGRGYLDQRLRKLTTELGLSEHVTFHGAVSEDDLIGLYNACDVFVLPSWAELEGMAVLEAMACGKPIVVANSRLSASTHFVDRNGLLFTPGDAEDLAQKLTTLITDNHMRKEMGRASRIISERYDIGRSVDKLEELYWSLRHRAVRRANSSSDCVQRSRACTAPVDDQNR